jgi:4-hydroxy-tetrahydrodipicolinate synthase
MIKGVHAATVTPFDARGEIDPRQLKSLLAFMARHSGIDGFLINGHAGEGAALSVDEQVLNLRYYIEQFGQDRFYTCGISCSDPAAAAANMRALNAAGAHAILVFPPAELRPSADRSSYARYFRQVCDASDLPVVLYRPSYFSGIMPDLDLMAELMGHEKVVAIKDGSWDVVEFEKLKRVAAGLGGRIDVLGSSDEHFIFNYLSGNVGCQASLVTLTPESIIELIGLAGRGEVDRAFAIHRKLAPLADYIYRHGDAVDMVLRLKVGMAIRGVIENPMPRNAAGRELAKVRQEMAVLLEQVV